ncbi:hypothetical protein CEW87_01890 [Parazoarcus communis]|uniref:Uncharacterized protein n=1 Tax=Parazoarcus communis TaxID=41977 RepID=A0A2U8GXK5_9RHOO|nr:hypothetical protein [Parazoarcus communis]AWI78208.1 hypothetical protein CEW87_01890 [Parazoarcus communis]
MDEPIAQLTIDNVCETRLRRTYTLLFPYSGTPVVAPRASAAATQPRTSGRAAATARPSSAGSEWITAPGESLTGIAQALYPRNSAAQRRFVREAAKANPALFPDLASRSRQLSPGTPLVVPSLAAISRNSPPPPQRTPQASSRADRPVSTEARREAAPGPVSGDRLIVAPEEADSRSAPPPTATLGDRSGEMSGLERREQEIATAIDRSIVTQMELLARIKELEQIQTRLMEQAGRIGVAPPPAAQPPAVQPPPVPPRIEPAPQETASDDWMQNAALALGGLGIAALLLLRSRRKAEDEPVAEPHIALAPQTPPQPKAVAEAPVSTSTADEFDAPLTQIPAPAGVLPLEWDHEPSGFGTTELAPLVEEEEVEEHDSAIELAEIMMSFGRVHGAAETLADFIRSNPKQAVTPWLKLLEVYRAADLRAEFDGLARQLNKTFNVKTVTWDNFDEARSAPDTLEKMPHLVNSLQQLWGTRECQAFLRKLLRDNRDGTRQGFPLNVIDDILCLSAILEQQLGPYRPTHEELEDNGPQTERPPGNS